MLCIKNKIDNRTFKNVKGNRKLHKKNKMAKKHMKRCLTTLVRKREIEITRHHYAPTTTVKINKIGNMRSN